jgi:hypothetical protein
VSTAKKTASMVVTLPQYPDTRRVVEWLEFTTFPGKKEVRLASDDDHPLANRGRGAAGKGAKPVVDQEMTGDAVCEVTLCVR